MNFDDVILDLDDVNKAIRDKLDIVFDHQRVQHDGRHFVMRDGEVIPASVQEWMVYFEKSDRTIASTYIGESHVSTVFLGLNHSFHSDYKTRPKIFETMIFGGQWGESQWRHSTLAEATEAHFNIVRCLQRGEEPSIDHSDSL